MTRRLALLAVLGLAVLAIAFVLLQFGILPFGRESESGSVSLATSTASSPSQTAIAILVTPSLIATPGSSAPLNQRPLNLPVLAPGDPCPISKGSREIVPNEGYIFCATCVWLGKGPVYFALSWHDDLGEDATFSLDAVPYQDGVYGVKTPWISKPDYAGPILIRGKQLDGPGENKLQFTQNGRGPYEEFGLSAAGGPSASQWSFWPAGMEVPGPGCYGVQIDTPQDTDIVIFKATKSEPTPIGTPLPNVTIPD